MIIVSDTSPVANLLLIGQLPLLEKLFGEVIIPPAVHKEIIALHDLGNDITGYTTSKYIKIIHPKNSGKIASLLITLDEGEAEAIVLAEELNARYLLIDERLGAATANKIGIKTIGLLAVLISAKERKLIDAVKPLITLLRHQGFWMSEKLILQVLTAAGEN
ncbi:MAG TPA: DUF3368 domain-containing protein [Parafilimonas sp.]|nr:DUF3368 domain-containing protein [Parafilimonas sp.]